MIDGTWRVKVTSGPWWFRVLNLLRDKKVIEGKTGHNVILGLEWGKFKVSKEGAVAVLIYSNHLIVDKVISEDEGRLTGRFYLLGKFIGTFEMTKE